MACVVVAGRNPLYELTAADLVVKQLEELSFINLKQLFGMERRVDPRVSFSLFAVTSGQWLASSGVVKCMLCLDATVCEYLQPSLQSASVKGLSRALT